MSNEELSELYRLKREIVYLQHEINQLTEQKHPAEFRGFLWSEQLLEGII